MNTPQAPFLPFFLPIPPPDPERARLENLFAKAAARQSQLDRPHRRRRTHCKHGHAFTPENTYYAPNGGRACKTCRNTRSRIRYESDCAKTGRKRYSSPQQRQQVLRLMKELFAEGKSGPQVATIINETMGLKHGREYYWRFARKNGIPWVKGYLTAEQHEPLLQRMTELFAIGIKGQDVADIINHEKGLNWTVAGYWLLAKQNGIAWQRHSYLAPHCRQQCFEDPAYEARTGIVDHAFCRDCFILLPSLGKKKGHIYTVHRKTVGQYRLDHPGAPINSFRVIAKYKGRPVAELMAECAERYATPAERSAAEKEVRYEANHGITDHVICVMKRCGLKSKYGLHRHLRYAHHMSPKEYRRQKGPRAIFPKDLLDRWSAEMRRRHAELAQRGIALPSDWDQWDPLDQAIGSQFLLGRSNEQTAVYLDANDHECRYAKTWVLGVASEQKGLMSKFTRLRERLRKPGRRGRRAQK